MAQEIEVIIRIRVTDEQLQAAGLSAGEFADNMTLFGHGFDIPSIVLSQGERDTDPVEVWDAAIVKAAVVTPPARSRVYGGRYGFNVNAHRRTRISFQ